MGKKNCLEDCLTSIISPRGNFSIEHYFMPALAIELGLREGVVLETRLVKYVKELLEKTEEKGLWRWNASKLVDYDDTLTSRNFFALLYETRTSKIPLHTSSEGAIYTYFGGVEAKHNNSIDLIINVRLLDNILNLEMQTENYDYLLDYLISKKEDFFKPVEEISKYYLSEGFLVYSLSKISTQIGIDIDDVIHAKLLRFNSSIDVALALLASPRNKKLQKLYTEYQNQHSSSELYLFQEPSTNSKFRSKILEYVINQAAKSISRHSFDEVIAKIYAGKGKTLYSYETDASSLKSLMNELRICANASLTELAVGTGNFLQHLIPDYFNILGIDISQCMINHAKEKVGNKVRFELIDAMNFSNLSHAIYCTNFIDLCSSGNVEIWVDNIDKARGLLKNMISNIDYQGYFFLHKKNSKIIKGYQLIQEKEIRGYHLSQTYLYQSSDKTIRRTYNKTSIPFDEFNINLLKLGLRRIVENTAWIVYQK